MPTSATNPTSQPLLWRQEALLACGGSPSQRGGEAQLFQGPTAARRSTGRAGLGPRQNGCSSLAASAKLQPCPRPPGGQSRSQDGLGTGSGARQEALPPRKCPPRPLTGEQLRSLGGDGPEQPLRGLRHGGTARSAEGQSGPPRARMPGHAPRSAPGSSRACALRRRSGGRPKGMQAPPTSDAAGPAEAQSGAALGSRVGSSTGQEASLRFLLVLPTRLWKAAQGSLLPCRRGWIGVAALSTFSLPRLSRRGRQRLPRWLHRWLFWVCIINGY